MGGWITIGTKIDSSGIDKGIDNIEKKMEKLRKKAEAPYEMDGVTVTGSWNLDEKEQQYYDRLLATLSKLQTQKLQMLNTDTQAAQVLTEQEQASSNLYKLIDGVMELPNGMRAVVKSADEVNDEVKELNFNFGKIKDSTEKVIKKVGKWALAIFSIRSAYMFVRQAVSTLSQYDEQLAADLEFIRYVLATTLEPVIRFIVDLVYKLLSALNSIWRRLFGVSLFSENLAKNFKSAKNQANGLKKTLAGFDEMNILNANGTTGISLTPSFDPSKANKDVDSWINKTIDKIQEFGRSILNLIPKYLIDGLKSRWQGLIDQIAGILLIIKGLFTGNFEDIKAGFRNFVKGAGEILKGLVSIINGIRKDILKAFSKIWDGLKSAFKDTLNGFISLINRLIDKVNSVLKPMRNAVAGVAGGVGVRVTGGVSNIPKMPKLAKGGIVNMPGRGVNYAGANIAERAPEAVIPFTDDQVMDRLGQAIARHMTINATVVNSMNGRVLSREIQRIQNQGDFAMNR